MGERWRISEIEQEHQAHQQRADTGLEGSILTDTAVTTTRTKRGPECTYPGPSNLRCFFFTESSCEPTALRPPTEHQR